MGLTESLVLSIRVGGCFSTRACGPGFRAITLRFFHGILEGQIRDSPADDGETLGPSCKNTIGEVLDTDIKTDDGGRHRNLGATSLNPIKINWFADRCLNNLLYPTHD